MMTEAWRILEAFTLLAVFLGAFCGNVTLFYVVSKYQSLQTRGNIFIVNLAAADFLVAVVNLPITAITVLADDWSLGKTVCQITGFITLLTFVASCMALSLININRYHAIVQWQSYKNTYTGRKCMVYLIVMWTITTTLCVPPFFGWARFDYDPGQSYCFADWTASKSYTIFMIAVCLCGPLSIMSYCYVRINAFHTGLVTSAAATKEKVNDNNDPNTYIQNRKKRLTRTILTLIVVFGICWSPFALIMVIQVFSSIRVPRGLDFGSLLLGYLNSFLNVIVYNATNRQIRHKFKKSFNAILCRHHN